MYEKDACCSGEGMMGMFDLSKMPMEMKKEFKMAMLKKKEKMLEAKLEFVREIIGMIKKSTETKE